MRASLDENHLCLMDCMEGMARFPDKFFELAIVDPPYGIGMDGGPKVSGRAGKMRGFGDIIKHHAKKKWDSVSPDKAYFAELLRVSKNQIIWGGNYFSIFLPASRGWIFWDKKATASGPDFSDGEFAWTSFDRPARKFFYDWIGFGYLNNPDREKKIHPTQKPVALYRWLLKNYAKPGDKILDTHAGSASSFVAAYEMGFAYFGFEIDPDYHAAASRRVAAAMAQGRLSDIIKPSLSVQPALPGMEAP